MTRAVVYLPDGSSGPGRIGDADLEVVRRGPAELVLPEATVHDVRGAGCSTALRWRSIRPQAAVRWPGRRSTGRPARSAWSIPPSISSAH
ncbi:hypothetical protein ACFQ0G_03025 [Streptomyces chiangmaiensis]